MLDLNLLTGLADVARVQARTYGDRTAFVYHDRRTGFAEMDARSSQLAQRLLQAAVGPGERVACLTKNSDFFFELWFGAMKARVCLAPVNFRLAAPEIAFILKDSRARILFVGADFLDLARAAVADLDEKPEVLALDGAHDGFADYTAWRNAAPATDPLLPHAPDDDVVQLYTSGTTGNPKGVQLSNTNYLAFLSLSRNVAGFDYKDHETVLNAMPLFHVGGTNPALAAYASGARIVIMKDIVAGHLIELIARERINHAFLVPAAILMLMNAPEMERADLSSMRTVSYGASPITEDLLLRAQQRFGCGFLQFYGMTETVGAGTYLPVEAHDPARGKLRSCGIPWPGIDVRVVDADGKDVAQGEVGEIVIRAPIVMKGYFNRPEATAEAVRDGWMRTGDAAYRDKDGFFFIYDRVKDMIVTGAENVYPAEVENAVASHPAVADVAVIGVPDERWGEAVKAVVVLRPGATADAEAIIAHVRERLASYKAPKTVDFVEAIPRNPTGKVLRRELRKPYWEGRGRMVG